MRRIFACRSIKSFTLVELLIVIAILAILAAAVVIVINPGEMMAEARDSQRISDIKSVTGSLSLFTIDNPNNSLGSANILYISIPDSNTNCSGVSGLPPLPSGWSYRCSTSTNLKKLDSTGWVPIDFSLVKGGSPIPYLPIDPVNTASGGYYTYVASGNNYELTSSLEAEKHEVGIKDGDSFPGNFRSGTIVSATPLVRDNSLVGYWKFDEGSGSAAYDSSGKNYNGVWAGTGARYATGKVGAYAAVLNGTDDNLSINDAGTYNDYNRYTISVFAKTTATAPNDAYGDRIITICRSPGTTRMAVGFVAGKAAIGWNGTMLGTSTDELYNDGLWHHIVATYDGSVMGLYVDGILKKTSTVALAAPTGENATLIGFIEGYGQYDGSIDDLRVYSRALSLNEIKAIYDNSK